MNKEPWSKPENLYRETAFMMGFEYARRQTEIEEISIRLLNDLILESYEFPTSGPLTFFIVDAKA